MANFIVSTDTCVDLPKSYLEQRGVHWIIMKRVLKGKEISEIFNHASDPVSIRQFNSSLYKKISDINLMQTMLLK